MIQHDSAQRMVADTDGGKPQLVGTRPRRPKALHIITSLKTGGAETQLAALCRAHGPNYHQIATLIDGGQVADSLAAAGFTIHGLGMTQGRPSLKGLVRLVRIIRAVKPDVVQSWLYHADLLATAALWLSGRRHCTGFAWNLRTAWDPRGKDLSEQGARPSHRRIARLAALLSRAPDILVANAASGITTHEMIGYRPRRTALIANGIDLERYRPNSDTRIQIRSALGLDPSRLVAIAVGRDDPMKDFSSLIQALDYAPDVTLVLVGPRQDQLPDHAQLIKTGPRTDVPALLTAADIVVSSSRAEGFSNALAEGMAAGAIPVATAVGDTPRILGSLGILVPPRDPVALGTALQRVAMLPAEERKLCAIAARARIKAEFSVQKMAAAYDSLYTELMAARSD